MSDTLKTLSDLTLINNANVADFGISNLYNKAPVLMKIAAVPASAGNTHSYRRLTGESAGGWRALNTGIDRTAAQYEQITEALDFLDCEHAPIDVAFLNGSKDPDKLIQDEIASAIRGGMFKFEQAMFNAVTGAPSSLQSRYNLTTNAYVVDAGGGSSTGHLTSVYLIRSADDNTGVAAVLGNGNSIRVGDTYQSRVTDGSGKTFTGVVTPAGAWLGLQIGAAYSCVRIANIDSQSSSTHKVTDALIYSALKLFPASDQPTMIVMDRTALEQLRASRTATNTTGAAAPRPTDVEGVQIVVTDAITDTETVVGAS